MYAPSYHCQVSEVKWVYWGQLNIVKELFLVKILTLGPEYGIGSNSSEIYLLSEVHERRLTVTIKKLSP